MRYIVAGLILLVMALGSFLQGISDYVDRSEPEEILADMLVALGALFVIFLVLWSPNEKARSNPPMPSIGSSR